MTSDHDAVGVRLHLDDIIHKPQFFITRDMRNMTFINMEPLMLANMNLQNVFSSDDPNIICERLLTGMNEVADLISPLRKKQNKKKSVRCSQEASLLKSEADSLLTEAIESEKEMRQDNFRHARLKCNQYLKKLEEDRNNEELDEMKN